MTFVPFRMLLFFILWERKNGSPYLPCRVCIILFWFACSMGTWKLFILVTIFGWPCLVNHFRSPFCQSGVYSACLDLMRVFFLSFHRFSISLLESFFWFPFCCMMLLKSFLHIFLRLAFLSQLRFLLLSLHILSTHRIKIRRLTTCFIHAILFGQQFDIDQVVINTIILYRDFSFYHCTPFWAPFL